MADTATTFPDAAMRGAVEGVEAAAVSRPRYIPMFKLNETNTDYLQATKN